MATVFGVAEYYNKCYTAKLHICYLHELYRADYVLWVYRSLAVASSKRNSTLGLK